MEFGVNMNKQNDKQVSNQKVQKKIYLSKKSHYYLNRMQNHMNQSISHIIETLIVDAFNKNNKKRENEK